MRNLGLLVLLLSLSHAAIAEQTAEKKIKILGKTVSASQSVDGNQDQVESVTHINLFGKDIEIAKSSVKYQAGEHEGISFNSDFYVNGRKVLAHGFADTDGAYAYTADIPPMDISGDLFSYSLGILSLGINSGVTAEGVLRSQLSSELLKQEPVYTPEMNLVSASANVDILAKGYIEGQVKIFFLKGGVGGSLNLIDGEAAASVSVNPANIENPEVAYQGAVHLLSGSLYGYIGSGRSRWISHDFYSSTGKCYAFGASSCPN